MCGLNPAPFKTQTARFSCGGAGSLGLKRRRALRFGGQRSEIGGQFLSGEGLDDVAFLDVIEVAQADAALHAVGHFADIVFDALERADLALEDLRAVACNLEI